MELGEPEKKKNEDEMGQICLSYNLLHVLSSKAQFLTCLLYYNLPELGAMCTATLYCKYSFVFVRFVRLKLLL